MGGLVAVGGQGWVLDSRAGLRRIGAVEYGSSRGRGFTWLGKSQRLGLAGRDGWAWGDPDRLVALGRGDVARVG